MMKRQINSTGGNYSSVPSTVLSASVLDFLLKDVLDKGGRVSIAPIRLGREV